MEWDVFISHASEDKLEVAAPLARALTHAGLRVWLDIMELKLGDSLRERIDDGLAKSRFGVVILSPSFFAKQWTTAELNGLFARDVNSRDVILPVWHDLDRAIVLEHSPMLADRVAVETKAGLREVTGAIIDHVLRSRSRDESIDARLSQTALRTLNELIDSESDLTALRDFLSYHHQILEHAVGATRSIHNNTYLLPRLDGSSPDFVVSQHLSTGGNDVLYIVCLASTAKSDFEESLASAADRLLRSYKYIDALASRNRYKFRINGVIGCGRRAFLSTVQKDYFQYLSSDLTMRFTGLRHSPFANFRNEEAQVRTYDWLIEAATRWEGYGSRWWNSELVEGSEELKSSIEWSVNWR